MLPLLKKLYFPATPGVTKKLNIIPEQCGIMEKR
jgi:hypothetical protein